MRFERVPENERGEVTVLDYKLSKERIWAIDEKGNTPFYVVISLGNDKLGRDVYNWSVMPGETCSKACMQNDGCYDDCYDMVSVTQYPEVRNARRVNTDAVKEHLEWLAIALDAYLSRYNPKYFRIHVGGDFLNSEYFEMWYILAEAHPETHFLAYTKQYDVVRYALNVMGVVIPENFSLYVSLWRNMPVPTDLLALLPVAMMYDGEHEMHTHNATICPGACGECGCKMCYHGVNVVFVQHGKHVSKKKHQRLLEAAEMLFDKFEVI